MKKSSLLKKKNYKILLLSLINCCLWLSDEEKLLSEFFDSLKANDLKSVEEYFLQLTQKPNEQLANQNLVRFSKDLNVDLDMKRIARSLGVFKKHPEQIVLPDTNPFQNIVKLTPTVFLVNRDSLHDYVPKDEHIARVQKKLLNKIFIRSF